MNDYVLAVLLGVVEGLTEFLPVSSTAHLRIAQAIMGVNLADGYWKMFAIVIQLGAILSLLFYFRKTLIELLLHFPRGSRGDRTILTHPVTLIAVAFVCTAVPSLLLSKLIGKNLERIDVMGVALIIGGLVMWAVDWYCARQRPRTNSLDEATMGQAVWIGLCQTLAPVFPGTSRSMATIVAGQTSGMSRTAALEFSFLLSIPTMAAATGYDFLKFLKSESVAMSGHASMVLLIGSVVSFVVAYAVVAWFMGWVRSRGFTVFAIYRLVAGVLVLVFAGQLGEDRQTNYWPQTNAD